MTIETIRFRNDTQVRKELMPPFYSDDLVTLLLGDVTETLRGLPEESVHCVVTSPPFWQLRNYRVEGQIGLEPTMEEYIGKLVAVFREVWRVLRSDGVCWIEIGDTYAATRSYQVADNKVGDVGNDMPRVVIDGLKPLDLANVPSRLALALQQDGWWHRSTLIWSRPNPMPESVHGTAWVRHKMKISPSARGNDSHAEPYGNSPQGAWDGREFLDHVPEYEPCLGCSKCTPNDGWVLRRGAWRPTDQHSYILMLTKSADYFCDQEAVREPPTQSTEIRVLLAASRQRENQDKRNGTVQADSYKRSSEARVSRDTFADARDHLVVPPPPGGRNMRTVLTIPTEPTSFAHFATFPQALVEPLILASTSHKGCCPECGRQWTRMVEHTPGLIRGGPVQEAYGHEPSERIREDGETQTLGWKATCEHGYLAPVPCTVLDPFCGTATTNIVARRYGRKSIGIDLSEPYLGLAVKRLFEAKKAQRKMAW